MIFAKLNFVYEDGEMTLTVFKLKLQNPVRCDRLKKIVETLRQGGKPIRKGFLSPFSTR